MDYEINQEFQDDFLVEKVDLSATKRGTTYASLQLRNKSGSYAAKWWDYNPLAAHILQSGKVVLIDGIMGEYQGAKQIKVQGVGTSDKLPTDFFRKSKFSLDEMMDVVDEHISSMEEPLTKHIATALLEKPAMRNAFRQSPAATGVHNNWVGGLLEHVVSMLGIASGVCTHYANRLETTGERPRFSKDKVFFGVIFHDIGKILEYNQNNPSFDKTPNGFLVNHITVGPAWVYHVGMSCPQDIKDTLGAENLKSELYHLMHLIASHHGQLDWGSPVPPATIEAIILHHIDNLDSKFMHALDLMESALEKDDGAKTSEYSRFERVKYLVR